ncbi:hypothetical protein SNE40_006572 [Patella caerulea]|uniref:GST C-terminal domain-containing protein n=1 Tax=Patella caerulea TaxID=87958 RepID=A0AAN8JXU8_PATCE
MLTETSGRYCHGDEITLADVFLLPQVFNAKEFQVNMKQFPIISRIAEELCQVDAFRLTQPSLQPDCHYRGKDQLSPLCKN